MRYYFDFASSIDDRGGPSFKGLRLYVLDDANDYIDPNTLGDDLRLKIINAVITQNALRGSL